MAIIITYLCGVLLLSIMIAVTAGLFLSEKGGFISVAIIHFTASLIVCVSPLIFAVFVVPFGMGLEAIYKALN